MTGSWRRCSVAIQCFTGWWATVLPLVLISNLVYVVGIPTLFILVVRHCRGRLHEPQVRARFSSLLQKYRQTQGREVISCELWEVMVCLRKLGIILLRIFLTRRPLLAAALATLVLAIALVAQLTKQPYQYRSNNQLEAVTLFSALSIILSGVAFEAGQWPSEGWAVVAGWVDVLVLLGTSAGVVVMMLHSSRKTIAISRRQSVANEQRDTGAAQDAHAEGHAASRVAEEHATMDMHEKQKEQEKKEESQGRGREEGGSQHKEGHGEDTKGTENQHQSVPWPQGGSQPSQRQLRLAPANSPIQVDAIAPSAGAVAAPEEAPPMPLQPPRLLDPGIIEIQIETGATAAANLGRSNPSESDAMGITRTAEASPAGTPQSPTAETSPPSAPTVGSGATSNTSAPSASTTFAAVAAPAAEPRRGTVTLSSTNATSAAAATGVGAPPGRGAALMRARAAKGKANAASLEATWLPVSQQPMNPARFFTLWREAKDCQRQCVLPAKDPSVLLPGGVKAALLQTLAHQLGEVLGADPSPANFAGHACYTYHGTNASPGLTHVLVRVEVSVQQQALRVTLRSTASALNNQPTPAMWLAKQVVGSLDGSKPPPQRC